MLFDFLLFTMPTKTNLLVWLNNKILIHRKILILHVVWAVRRIICKGVSMGTMRIRRTGMTQREYLIKKYEKEVNGLWSVQKESALMKIWLVIFSMIYQKITDVKEVLTWLILICGMEITIQKRTKSTLHTIQTIGDYSCDDSLELEKTFSQLKFNW